MGVQPAAPGVHQSLGFAACIGFKVQHAPRPSAARAALGVTADRALLLKELQGLLQHGFRKPQLGLLPDQFLQESGGVVVVFEQALEDPADSQLEIEELRRRLMEVLLDICQTGARRLSAREHRRGTTAPIKIDLISRFNRRVLRFAVKVVGHTGPIHS